MVRNIQYVGFAAFIWLSLSTVFSLQAQTRLGLHVTKEELHLWRQRAASGPYKSRSDVSLNSPEDWTRITNNANAFKANPAAFRWSGPSLLEASGAVKKGGGDDVRLQNEPNGKALAHQIRDAAFVLLVDDKRTDRAELKKAIKAELLHATTIRSLDFNNRTLWPATYYRDINPLFQTMNWFNNYLYAYDYVDIADKLSGESTFTAEERRRIDQWLLAAASFAQGEQDWDVNRLFTNRSTSPADAAYQVVRTQSPAQRNGTTLVTHYTASGPGHTIYGLMQTFNNRRMACHRYAALVGLKLGKPAMVESAKRFVKDWIKYSVFPDGTMGEMERWSGSIPDLGWAYCTDVIASAVTIADGVARTGDQSLYDYSTSVGMYGTEGKQGESKSLHKTLKVMYQIAAKRVQWYGTNQKQNCTKAYLIDGETDSWKALHDVWLTMANLKYKDKDIKAMYMRQGAGMTPYWSNPVGQGKHPVWTGDWGIFPGLLFMFGQMEEQPSPYIQEKTETITPTISPLVLDITTKDASCYGQSTGAATVTVTGGVAPFTYTWSHGKTTAQVSDLHAANYTVTVKDQAGTTKKATVTIAQPSIITITEKITPATAKGNDGSISVIANGGSGNYYYKWSTGAITKDISGLSAGSYMLTVTDANGCTATKIATVTQTQAPALGLTVSSMHVTCYQANDGKAIAVVTGGVAPYSYTWSNGKTTAQITDLVAGNYTVTVTDKTGSKKTATVSLAQPSAIVITEKVTAQTAQGKDGSIELTVSGGTGAYSYKWSTGATTKDLSGLAAGSYSVTVTDANGCSSNSTIALRQQASLASIQSFTLLNGQQNHVLAKYNPLADQDTINLSLLPSRLLNIRANTSNDAIASVSFSLNRQPFSSDATAPFYLSNGQAWTPAVGKYELTATAYTKDGQTGGSLTIRFYIIDQPVAKKAEAIEPLLSCVKQNEDGTLTAYFGYVNHNKQALTIAAGADNRLSSLPLEGSVLERFEPGRQERAFSVSFDAGMSLQWLLTGPDGEQRKAEVKADSPVCAMEAMGIAPRVMFSPNEDGIDDLWQITNIEQYPDYEVVVFNRNGRQVYQAKPYSNNWDGRFQGKPLMPEAYFFVIKKNNQNILTGSVTIIR